MTRTMETGRILARVVARETEIQELEPENFEHVSGGSQNQDTEGGQDCYEN